MMAEKGEYLDVEGFAELPRDSKSVTQETFQLVFDHIWPGYLSWCKENEFWDDQDLVRNLLELVWEGQVVVP